MQNPIKLNNFVNEEVKEEVKVEEKTKNHVYESDMTSGFHSDEISLDDIENKDRSNTIKEDVVIVDQLKGGKKKYKKYKSKKKEKSV